VIYVDSSALVKMVRVEPESGALNDWLNRRSDELLVASALVEVEVHRAVRSSQPELLPDVPATLARVHRIEIDAAIRARAAEYPNKGLRSLDAIHLATADQLVASGKTVAAFVSYDDRLNAAADALGLSVIAPGAQVRRSTERGGRGTPRS
jgi:uncharacterized protein